MYIVMYSLSPVVVHRTECSLYKEIDRDVTHVFQNSEFFKNEVLP